MICEEIRERLLAHLYEAIDDDEAAEVSAHLEGCDACRAALAEAEEERSVLAEAARGSAEGMEFRPPPPRRRLVTMPRVAAAAAILLAAAGLLIYRTALRMPILAEHPVYVVTGPESFLAGEVAEFEVVKETIEGDPLPLEEDVKLESATRAETLLSWTLSGKGRTAVRVPPDSLAAGTAAYFKLAEAPDLPVVARHPEALAYVATDKPLYRPGEVIRMRAVLLERFRLAPAPDRSVVFRVKNPRGEEVAGIGAWSAGGVAHAEFALDPSWSGGDYRISVEAMVGDVHGGERTVAVRSYRVPRLKTHLELSRESYGPGEEGAAWLSVERAEGGVPVGATVEATLTVDGADLALGSRSVPESGALTIPFAVPDEVEKGRAVLTAIVRDGGNVEAASKTVPVSLGRLDVEILPEGGEVVAGLPCRVYFRVRSPAGEPADLVADVVDDGGRRVAEARTEVLGLGRFALTPEAGRSYRLVPRSPAGIDLAGAEFRPVGEGVALAAVADGYPAGGPIEVEVASSFDGDHEVVAYCRGQLLARRTVALDAGETATVSLEPTADVGGVVRITVLDPEGRPQAERLVSREPGRRLTVTVDPVADDLSPGAEATVNLRTLDEAGRPVSAALGVAVVDDAVLALADDEDTAPLPLHFLLGVEVEELENVSLFLGAGRATDLLLGSQGWRRFAWRDPAALVADRGETARRVIATAPETAVARVDNREAARSRAAGALAGADRKVRRAAGVLLLVLGVGAAFVLLARIRPVRFPRAAAALAAAGLGAVLVVLAAEPEPELKVDVLETATAVDARVVDALAGPDPRPGAVAIPEDLPGEPELGLGEDPAAGIFFNDGADGDFRGRRENLFDEAIAGDRIALAKDARVRTNPVFAYRTTTGTAAGRSDFAEVLYWHPMLVTDAEGKAELSFQTCDSITTFRIVAEGHDATGGLGRGESSIRNRIPFYVEPKLPVELSARDELLLPVVVANATVEEMDVDLTLSGTSGLLKLPGDAARRLRLPANGSARAVYRLLAGDGRGDVALTLVGEAPGGLADRVTRTVSVVPRGYPMEVARGGALGDERTAIRILLPPEMDRNSLTGGLTVYPSALATLVDGLEAMLRTPGGCFEQASSTNYPNTLILSYLSRTETAAPGVARRARMLLDSGYELLTGYECRQKGYEWFGADPANPALTAYGLLEFTDMAEVHDVDEEMVERTRGWLLAARDGEGGFRFDRSRALDSFGSAPADVTEAYVLWALTESDAATDLEPELTALAERAERSDDPYLVALAALALGNRENPAAAALTARLAGMQEEDGSLVGKTTSITSSRGENLVVETTALAALAFLRDPARRAEAEAAIGRLLESRRGGGAFGATQATILALKALVEHARFTGESESEMGIRVFVNGRVVANGHIHEGMREPLVFGDEVLGNLRPGENLVEIDRIGEGSPPFALSVNYHTSVPPADAACAVRLETKLDRAEAKEGESVGLQVRLRNTESEGIPMTLARIGVPAGLTPRAERLRELVDAGEIAFFELRPREVTLYLRGMAPGETRELSLDLTAEIPGLFESPASSAYLYYTDDAKWWTPPLRIHIE